MIYRQRFGKYKSTRQECLSGHWHHSKMEAGKCDELRLQKIAGEILNYDVQKRTRLYLGRTYMGSMITDFYVYHLDGMQEFLETKGKHLVNEFRFKRNWEILQQMHNQNKNIKFTLEIFY